MSKRDAFGRLLIDPECLDLAGRVDCLRRAAGELAASDTAELRWLAAALLRWLHNGGELADVLGLRPHRGSRTTPQALVAQEARDRALLRLSAAAGGDATSLALLRDELPCPAHCVDSLEEARRLRVPASRAAFTRARQRASRERA